MQVRVCARVARAESALGQGCAASARANAPLSPRPPPSSYNAVNGVPSCANDWLLGTLLRGEWEFDGYVRLCGAQLCRERAAERQRRGQHKGRQRGGGCSRLFRALPSLPPSS